MTAILKTTVVQEPSSTTANLTLSTSGGVTVGQNLTVTGTTTLTGSTTLPSSISLTTPTLATPNIISGLTLTGAAGTSGQYLTSAGSGAAPTWSTPSAGAMTLISTQTVSSGSTISFTGLSGYNKYQLIFDNLNLAGTNQNITLVFGTGATPTYITSGYNSNLLYVNSSSVIGSNSSGNSYIFIARSNTPVTGPFAGSYILSGLTSSSYATVNGNFYASTSGGGTMNGNVSAGAVVTAIQLGNYPGSTFSSGTVSLYGISS